MKKIALMCLFAVLTFGTASAQNKENNEAANIPANGAKISFNEMEHDYGTIMKGGNGVCEFHFTNDGNEPLILSNVRASCGCTTPSYTQKPVMPGQTGTIQVKYNTNNVGKFSKTVTVYSNAVNAAGGLTLRITGVVKQEAAAESKPAPAAEPKAGKPAESKPAVKAEADKPADAPARMEMRPAMPSEKK